MTSKMSKLLSRAPRDILMERFSEDAALMGRLRNHLWDNGEIRASVVEKNKADAAKFSDYFDYSERLKKNSFPTAHSPFSAGGKRGSYL